MKKILIIVLLVVLSFYSLFSTAVIVGVAKAKKGEDNRSDMSQIYSEEVYLKLESDYNKLKSDYDELKKEYLLLIDGDENKNTTKPADDEKPVVSPGKFDADEVLSLLNITEYSCKNSWWPYYFLVIENTSNYNLEVSADVRFYNEANQLIGAKSAEQEAFEKNTKTLLYFSCDEDFANVEYILSVDEEKNYECVVSELSYETTSAKDKEIVSVTNNGNEAADFVKLYALFFDGDRVVDFQQTYFVDDGFGLEAGKTITKEIHCFEEYDSVQFFLTGRR